MIWSVAQYLEFFTWIERVVNASCVTTTVLCASTFFQYAMSFAFLQDSELEGD